MQASVREPLEARGGAEGHIATLSSPKSIAHRQVTTQVIEGNMCEEVLFFYGLSVSFAKITSFAFWSSTMPEHLLRHRSPPPALPACWARWR